MGRLTAIILGSAAGGAFPQWNCRCPVCQLAWTGDPRVRPRTQAGIAVTANDGRWTLINASPDLAAQIRRNARTPSPEQFARQSNRRGGAHWCRNRSGRGGFVAAREHGIYTLCNAGKSRGSRRQCHGRRDGRNDAARDQSRRTLRLAGGIEATLFMVPGKLPLYLEGKLPASIPKAQRTSGSSWPATMRGSSLCRARRR